MPSISSNTRIAIATFYAAIFTGFGINAILRPDKALSFFEWQPPSSIADPRSHALYINLTNVYGIRDIYGGIVLLTAGVFGNNRTLGATLVATAVMAFGDGYICFLNGAGQWNHWSYAPMLAGVGAWLMS